MQRVFDIMEYLPTYLKEDYERYKKIIHNEGYSDFVIKPDDVLRAHYLIADFFANDDKNEVLYGVKTPNLLYSAVNRQETGYEGKGKWNTPLEKCATLYYGLVKNHAFHDGNKRTALLVVLYNLHLIKRTPTENQKEFEKLTVRIASGKLSDYKVYEKYKNKDDCEVLINEKAAKSILKDIGVVDNYNFFKGGEPLYKLLEDYRAPLLRLKDE